MGEWDEFEADTAFSELLRELDGIQGESRGRRPIVREPLKRGIKIAVAVVAVAVSMGVVAAVVLFSHTFNYTAPTAKLSTTCPTLTTTVAGSTLVFACSANPALSVASTATGTVTYSAFSPAPPVSILDIYLIDTVATLGATCGTTSSNANEPVALAVGGGSITVSQSAGNPRPGHNYDYCMDFAVLPPSFSTGVSWSQ